MGFPNEEVRTEFKNMLKKRGQSYRDNQRQELYRKISESLVGIDYDSKTHTRRIERIRKK